MKILIIDDDPIMTELLRLVLQPTAEVIVAHSGGDGIKFAGELLPDIIIVDGMLPDMEGVQVCQAVRQFSSIPIMILSALDTPRAIAAALNMGADDYMVKPVSCNLLLARIYQLIRRSRKTTVEQTPDISVPVDGKDIQPGFHVLVEK